MSGRKLAAITSGRFSHTRVNNMNILGHVRVALKSWSDVNLQEYTTMAASELQITPNIKPRLPVIFCVSQSYYIGNISLSGPNHTITQQK